MNISGKKLLLSALFSFSLFCVKAQETTFIPPFDFPIVFSGNFGELRSNHFHGGLDFKTQGVIGKPMRALADGYISRIRVTHGSGYVLDVVYNDRYHTISRHLEAFVGDIAKRVEALQYSSESWEVDITPKRDEYPVKAGEIIALSGNTGYSFGPHLHLDVIDLQTNEYIDPLPFFKHKVNDNTAPRANGIIIFPQAGKGVLNGQTKRKTFSLEKKDSITAWGTIGVGIKAYDYMDGVHNRYGVHTVILEVDKQEVFRSVVDRYRYYENPYINSWTQGNYMKSFLDPGNHLSMLHTSNGNRGLITIDEERPYHFVYTLSDALGNTRKVRFTIYGKRSDIPQVDHRPKHIFHWNKVNYLQDPGIELLLPKGVLYDDVCLNYEVRADSGDIAFTYQLHNEYVPLHRSCDIKIGLRHRPNVDSTKLYVASVSKNGKKHSVGGKYENGYMKARIGGLATYTVAIDTIPPTITPINQQSWEKTGRIVIKPKDKETGVVKYRGTIDGKYALFGKPNSISGNLVCKLNPNHIKRGCKHTLVMTITDGCGNVTEEQFQFHW